MQQEDTAGAILHIDLEALAQNYRAICFQVAPTPVAAVVKADGYGIGAIPVARTLIAEGCRHFFVAHLSEAAALKPALPQGVALHILNGLHPGAENACAALGAIPVLNALDQIARWSATASTSSSRPPP